MTQHREIVVAAYEEPLEWIQDLEDRVTLYIKSPARSDYPEAMRLPNIGREAHTYAWHIVNRYENLAEETVFLQGRPFDHMSDRSHYFYLHGLEHKGDIKAMGELYMVNALGHPLHDVERYWRHQWDVPLGEVWARLFTTPMPKHLVCIRGAQFLVSRDLIRSRSLGFWNRVLAVSAEHHAGPWALECLWMYVFDPRFHTIL